MPTNGKCVSMNPHINLNYILARKVVSSISIISNNGKQTFKKFSTIEDYTSKMHYNSKANV